MTTSNVNRVWIEIERPKHGESHGGFDHHALAKERAKLASNMIRRLCPNMTYDPFWWNERENRFCYQMDSGGTYTVLNDDGHWLNLDYLGRAED